MIVAKAASNRLKRLRILGLVFSFIAALSPTQRSYATYKLEQFQTERGSLLPVYEVARPDAVATLVLLPGANANTGEIIDGALSSQNFLVRTKQFFFDQGLNVLVVFKASDQPALGYSERVEAAHQNDLKLVLSRAKEKFGKPVWLVGTSRGNLSATAAAIKYSRTLIDGLVLISSITSRKDVTVATQDIGKVTVPTLIVHHERDGCKVSVPSQASKLPKAFTNAPQKRYLLIQGGSGASGKPCGAQHYHGFINFERETVAAISE